MRVDQPADDLERQTFGRRIHCEDAAAVGAMLLVAQVDILARLELAVVEKPTVPVISRTSPFEIDRSSEGLSRHDTSIIPVASFDGLKDPGPSASE
jgi:hypothetical protein